MQATDISKSDHLPVDTTGQHYINLSGYRFIPLDYLPILQADLHAALTQTGILGTILLADEGINVALSGTAAQCQAARAVFEK